MSEFNPNATISRKANLRVLPDQSARQIGTLLKGADIEILGEVNAKYTRVSMNGYIWSDFGKNITLEGDAPPVYKPNAICTAKNYVNIRTGPDKSYKDIGNLTANEKCMVLDEDLNDDYAHILTAKGVVGYAYCDEGNYIKFLSVLEEPTGKLAEFLDIVESCVGGYYIYGAQGHKITTAYVNARYKAHPEYMSGGRYKMLLDVAKNAEAKGVWRFPEDYAWDCSGLFWYAENKLDLFPGVSDSKAKYVFSKYCDEISKSESRPGDCVGYRSPNTGEITHMAIVGRNGKVYEAMSGYVGVVVGDNVDDRTAYKLLALTDGKLEKYTRGAWNVFGRPKVFA